MNLLIFLANCFLSLLHFWLLNFILHWRLFQCVFFTINYIVEFLDLNLSIINLVLISVDLESRSFHNVSILILVLFELMRDFIYSLLLFWIDQMLFRNLLMTFLNFSSSIFKPLLRFFFSFNLSRKSYLSVMKTK